MLHTEAGPVAPPNWLAGQGIKRLAYWIAFAAMAACVAATLNYKKDERYLAAEAFARASPAVVAEVGAVSAIRLRRTIAVQAANIMSADTVYQFKVCGENGSANVVVRATPEGSPSSYRFTIDGLAR